LPSCDDRAAPCRIGGVTKCLGVLVATLVLTACAGAHSAAPSLSRAKARHAVPPATQWVDTHGIELAVPAAWRLGRQRCGTPQADTVLWLENGVLDCLAPGPSGLSVVEFGGILHRPDGWYRRHTARVTIDGALARRWATRTAGGSHEVQLVFPRRGISVTVFSPHRSLLRRILASVRTIRVNKYGCSTRPRPSYALGSPPRPSRPFVPTGAVRMVGCSYHGQWLDLSSRIGRRAAARLVRALDAASYGLSRAPRGSILPSICGSLWRGSFVVARFEYAARPAVSVTAHLDGCSRLGASNGRWAVRMAPRWVFQLTRQAGYAGGFVDPRTAR
jgi:hypothetical protein